MTKNLINAAGALIVLAALAAGILLLALPVYVQSTATGAEAVRVAQGNGVYEAQVAGLYDQRERFGEISSDVARLQGAIPATNRHDDVFEIVGRVAAETGAQVVSVIASDAEAWAPRVDPFAEEGAAVADAPALEPEEAPEAPTAPDAADAAAGDATAGEPASEPRMQVPFSIVVETSDPSQAIRFLDLLGTGPRLLSVTHSVLSPAGDGFQLTVSALTFVRHD